MSIDSESLLEMRKVRSPSWLHAGFSRFPLERELILCVLASLLLALTDCTKPAPPPAPLESVTRPGARPETRVCVGGGEPGRSTCSEFCTWEHGGSLCGGGEPPWTP